MKLLVSDYAISALFYSRTVCFADRMSANSRQYHETFSIVFFYSKSVLQAFQSRGWANPLILQLPEHHPFLSTVLAKTIHFYWVPSRFGIKVNDLTDQAVKDDSSIPLPYTNRRRHINTFIRCRWQNLWDEALNNKLHTIQTSLGCWPGNRRNARREEVILARIRLWHT